MKQYLAPAVRFERTAKALTVPYSTTELRGNGNQRSERVGGLGVASLDEKDNPSRPAHFIGS
jgi:hypothetical protein